MMHLVASFVTYYFYGKFSYKHNSKPASQFVSFLYKFDDDMVAIDPPNNPINYDHDDLQLSCSSFVDSTYTSPSCEEESSHPVTLPRRSN